MKMKIGYCQFKPIFLQKEKNLERMLGMIDKKDADLLVFPELATSGYTFVDKKEVEQVAESFEHGLTRMFIKKAAWENKCSIVVGFAERDGDKIYNSSLLANPDGSCHLYRKVHLFLNEKKFFTPGDLGFPVFNAKNGLKLGMMICFDWFFPEAARTLMLKGAQVIAHPANLVLPWCQQAMLTRALENRVFTITANRTGKEINGQFTNKFTGMSQVTNTIGERLLQADENTERCEIVEIDTSLADNKAITDLNEIIGDRKPQFYR